MLEKSFLDGVLRKLTRGGLEVRYWEGSVARYGNEAPALSITVKSPKVVRAMIRNLTLGFGEAYMNGDINLEGDITQIGRFADQNKSAFAAFDRIKLPRRAVSNRRSKQRKQISHHYDMGNDFYSMWLDESMTYSCAYFNSPSDTLELAQDQKIAHILRKLQLSKDQTLLDIGCGWGKLLITAAKTYGVKGYGITLSDEQFRLATARVAEAGLSDKITIELVNYQELAERRPIFDRIVSVGMYEHVGKGNHAAYFKAVKQMLAPNGISVLHSITSARKVGNDAWIDKYIFPGGYLPTVADTAQLMQQYGFELQDYENLRHHYALTLEEWLRRYESHEDEVTKMYDERFYRMWRLYLAGSVSGFRYGDLNLSQFVFTPGANLALPLTRDFLYARN